MLEKNQCFTAEVIDLTAEGNGVCRVENAAVFVPGTAVGDVIKLKIVKVLKSYAFGIAEEIISPSPDRIDSDCDAAKKCGGCTFRHISYQAECRIKDNIVKSAFKRIGGLDPVFEEFVGCEAVSRYRNKAQYPLASINGNAVYGFYAPRSHRLIPIKDCALQPEIFSEIASCILAYINERKLSVYSEESNTGLMRHIYLRKGAHSGEIMVCLVVRKDMSRQLMPLCSILMRKFSNIVSIIMNINPDKTNVILGKKCVTLAGKDTITDTMCGNSIEISPLSFYQVNTVQAERLYAKALEYAEPGKSDVIADLYCGAGTIGLSMAKSAEKIVGVEIVPQAIDNARINAAQNNIDNADFFCGDAGAVFSQLRQNGCAPDIIVVDPPRKGCSLDSLNTIADAAPRKIVMISCNPATAARDAKWLSENGYSIVKVCGVDLFPRTGHVECVVLMSRDKA
ncbi:MAG: 23S rRNA (uracil(1939)-C(5))-methyltransferase RlmD [Ruminococcus sp.]|nr:23S rRNA (uracil(1939)-C(5))-methyltransferase RlmD [Ruminococcus sp.]